MSENLTEIADILDRAADHIDTVGWLQGSLYGKHEPTQPLTECRVCAIGALNMALYGSPSFALRDPAPDEVTAHDVAEYLQGSRTTGLELAEWNDTEGRTQNQVTALLRETAAELRGAAA